MTTPFDVTPGLDGMYFHAKDYLVERGEAEQDAEDFVEHFYYYFKATVRSPLPMSPELLKRALDAGVTLREIIEFDETLGGPMSVDENVEFRNTYLLARLKGLPHERSPQMFMID